MPEISVVIAAFNKEQSIRNTLDSILQQSFVDYEIIVVDDGSVDQTASVVKAVDYSNVKYFHQDNQGVTAARNKGVELSSGRYLTFLDADDWVAADWLEQFYSLLSSGNFDIVFCDVEVRDQSKQTKKVTKARFPYRDTVEDRNGLFLTGAFCVERDFFVRLGMYDSCIRFGENAELSFRCQQVQPRIGFTEQTGLYYEISGSGGGKNYRNRIVDTLYIIQKHTAHFNKHPHALRLYYQSVAVGYQQLRSFGKAAFYFLKAWIVQPANVRHLVQACRAVGYALLPFLYSSR